MDQFNADERLWKKLEPKRRARRKLRPRLPRKKLKKLDLLEQELKIRLNAHEPAIVDVLQRIMKILDSRRPERFANFIAEHRQWMVRLMERQFGRRPSLSSPQEGEGMQ